MIKIVFSKWAFMTLLQTRELLYESNKPQIIISNKRRICFIYDDNFKLVNVWYDGLFYNHDMYTHTHIVWWCSFAYLLPGQKLWRKSHFRLFPNDLSCFPPIKVVNVLHTVAFSVFTNWYLQVLWTPKSGIFDRV